MNFFLSIHSFVKYVLKLRFCLKCSTQNIHFHYYFRWLGLGY